MSLVGALAGIIQSFNLEVTMLAFYMLVSIGLCIIFYSGPLFEPGVNASWEESQFPLV
jgi:hypothetical protein